MSETPNTPPQNTGGNEAGEQPGLQILTQYVRDLSFENPAAPALTPPDGGNPDIGVDANVNARKLAENDFEVGLKFTILAKFGAQVAFIAELMFCGVFRLIIIPENDVRPGLSIDLGAQTLGPDSWFHYLGPKPWARQAFTPQKKNILYFAKTTRLCQSD